MAIEKKQFIYVLKLIPSLLFPENWTDKEEKIVDSHFSRLLELRNDGRLILAGKTSGLDDKTFGIVILEVDSDDEALTIMQQMAQSGHIDPELFALFLRTGIYLDYAQVYLPPEQQDDVDVSQMVAAL